MLRLLKTITGLSCFCGGMLFVNIAPAPAQPETARDLSTIWPAKTAQSFSDTPESTTAPGAGDTDIQNRSVAESRANDLASSQSDWPQQETSDDSAAANTDPEKLPLKKPTGRFASGGEEDGSSTTKSRSLTSQILTPLLSLAGVIALIFGLSKLVRKQLPTAVPRLSSDVVDVLGRRVIDQRNSLLFVHTGQRILVLGSSLEGLNTLTEITDPVEIDLIRGQCQSQTPASSPANSFKMLLSSAQRKNSRVDLDSRHRQRQQSQRNQGTQTRTPSSQASTESSSPFSSDHIADLEKTLEAAREGRL